MAYQATTRHPMEDSEGEARHEEAADADGAVDVAAAGILND